jgi:sulfatase maturation enzyme AslB (radical SAM superfamily)
LYSKSLDNLEKIRRTNGPNPSSLPVDNTKSVTSIVVKSSNNHKGFNMWCHYCDNNNHKTADCRAIAKSKQQKKAHFAAKARPGENSLVFLFLFEEINALKRRLKPENPSFIFSTVTNSFTSSDEGEEYLFTSSKPFSSSKTKLEKSFQHAIIH